MIRNVIGNVWTEPRAARPPARLPRDWALVGLVIGTAVLETAVRTDVVWRPVALAQTVALAFLLLWRRTHPFAVLAVAFGFGIGLELAGLALGVQGQLGLYSGAFTLLLPYALFRWGSGWEITIGSMIMAAVFVPGLVKDGGVTEDTIGGLVVLSLLAALGLSVRFWGVSRARELDQVRLREREDLARELHDTVAHHVSAMVVRAQAGRVLAASRPAAALEALQIIETEGSRTLTEMRIMVSALRHDQDADLSPSGAIVDIQQLARPTGDQPEVQVMLSAVPPDVSPAVEAALFRIAREAVTNATRHARHARQITVRVTGADDQVRLSVRDDGDPVPATRPSAGYGIVGMTERATLLGGSLEAGPGPDRGWQVDAVLPRTGSVR